MNTFNWLCSFIQLQLLVKFLYFARVVDCLSISSLKTKLQNKSTKYPLLLVSFDGFRWDYIQRRTSHTPTFDNLIKEGVSVQYGLKNAFVTKTFPNHFTLVTGLWEENHGIVGNEMYDPHLNQTFTPQNSSANRDPAWFDVGAEPIWVTNKLQNNGKSGACMWVGAGAPIKNVMVDRFIPYNATFSYTNNVDSVIKWFIDNDPINLGLIYFDQPDIYGHQYGPDSKEVDEKIEELDSLVEYLLKKLNESDLLQNMNIIITSDHGFTNTPSNKVINLDQYINSSTYDFSSLSPVALIWPKEGQFDDVYNGLKKGEVSSGKFVVYKQEDLPEMFHYKYNVRISPIVAVASDTYSFETQLFPFHQLGNHGYDNRLQDMHPFFIAVGPSFKKNFVMDTFNSVDIYPLMCHLLHLKPAPNNGSLDIVSQLLADGDDETVSVLTLTTYVLSIFLIIVVASVFTIAVCYYWRKADYTKYTSLSSKEISSNYNT